MRQNSNVHKQMLMVYQIGFTVQDVTKLLKKSLKGYIIKIINCDIEKHHKNINIFVFKCYFFKWLNRFVTDLKINGFSRLLTDSSVNFRKPPFY